MAQPKPAPSPVLVRRFLQYQGERFPLAVYVPLIAAFTFSAASYSGFARGAETLVPLPLLAAGTLTALTFFFLLRVLDEHKDADIDLRYRPELPVPRGLVTLAELRWIGGVALAAAVVLNAGLHPPLLAPIVLVAVWAALMTREFFVPAWLRAHPTAYLVSHMLIMPIIDAYTTGLDWIPAGSHPGVGLWFFLGVTFLNGVVIEIGRKIRHPDGEREGVVTYTGAWGVRAAPRVWLAVTFAAAVATWLAARHTGAAPLTLAALCVLLPLSALPAVRFLRSASARDAEGIQTASGFWTLTIYLLLGGGPWIARWIGA
jgi:4-hydroxybenzoate polyprenyltransferase